MRSRTTGSTESSASRLVTSLPHSSAFSGSSRIEVAFNFPPAHPGRSSSSSGRAMHASRIGASRARSAMCSTSSRNVSSAHWRSSITNTTGRSAASRSSSARTAQRISSGVVSPPWSPIACPTRSAIATASTSSPRQHRELAAGCLRGVVLAQARDVDQGLGERVERDPLAVRQAPTAQDRRPGTELVGERRHEPGLAHAPDAEHREELARLIRHRAVEHVAEERQLAFPSDDGGVEMSCEPGGTRHHLDQPVCRHGIGLPLHGQIGDRLGDDRVAHE